MSAGLLGQDWQNAPPTGKAGFRRLFKCLASGQFAIPERWIPAPGLDDSDFFGIG